MNNERVIATITKNQIGILTFNRPDKHNAFDNKMITEIIQKLHFFQQQPIRFLIINANGTHFCAGADLNWMAHIASKSIDENLDDATELAKMLSLIYHFEKPTVALVQGSALGGGAGIACACDIVIASNQAQFGFTETKIGLIPATISPYVIKSIGQKWAKYYFLTAELFSASTALKIGLCHDLASDEQLIDFEKLPVIERLSKNGPIAMCHVKKLVSAIVEIKANDPNLVPMTANMIAQLRASKEGQEGIAAFIDKRQPNWIIKK